MKIYKFKDLSDQSTYPHVLQIVLNNSIWCAKPDSLNDDEEFKFKLDYGPSANTLSLLSEIIVQHRTTNFLPPNTSASMVIENSRLKSIAAPIIEDLIEKCRNSIGITSFSMNKNDDCLWEKYGGRGNGVCVEINIPDYLIDHSYHKVHYVAEKIFHVDSFLESALYADKAFATFSNILLTKTRTRWEQEEEIRFIGNRQEVNFIIDGHISEIIFGSNVPVNTFNQLMAEIAEHCNSNLINVVKLADKG